METQRPQVQTTIDLLKTKIESKHRLNGGTTVIGPWDQDVSSEQRARWHAHLLYYAYGGGHPASLRPIDDFIREQKKGKILSWFLLSPDGEPVGMANIEILPNGVAEMCRTCRLKKGEPLVNGNILNKDYNNTVVMYQRLVDLLATDELKNKIWALQADLRLADEIKLDGESILAGVATQHINLSAGLRPFLVCVPRYQVNPQKRNPHQEIFLESMFYTQPEGLRLEPIFTPSIGSPVTIGDIVKVTYPYAFGVEPEIVDLTDVSPWSSLNLEATAGIHFSTIMAEGNISKDDLAGLKEKALNQSRFVELIVPNKPANIATQRVVYEVGFIPLGVKPGGDFLVEGRRIHVPTTIHFGLLRDGLKKTIPAMKLADELVGLPLDAITHSLRQTWKS